MQPSASCADSGGNLWPVEKTIGMPLFLRRAREIEAAALARKMIVAEDQVDVLAIQKLDRVLEAVERRDDLITEVAEHHFIVESRERLILDDENSIDDAFALPEQHSDPKTMASPPQRTKRKPVPRHRSRNSGFSQKPVPREDGPQRIAKLLARAGIASRRDIERMIAEGRIALNGETLKTPATLLTDLAGVTVDGKAVRPPAATRLFRFYKPQGTLTAAQRSEGPPDHLRPAAAGPPAGHAGRPPRFHDRRAAAAHQ